MPRRRPQRPRLLQGHAVRLPHGVADKQNMAYPHEDNGAGAGALVRPGGPAPPISRYDKPSPTAKPLPSRGERRKRLPRESPSDSPRVGANGIVRRRADTKRADLTDGSNCDAGSARTLRRMAGPPRTIGARGLNFRVRNGTGCASPAMVADQQGAFCCQGRLRAVPWGPHSVTSGLPRRSLELGMKRRARPISTARLNPSRGLHLRPIELVVYEWPYRRENSSRDWLPA